VLLDDGDNPSQASKAKKKQFTAPPPAVASWLAELVPLREKIMCRRL